MDSSSPEVEFQATIFLDGDELATGVGEFTPLPRFPLSLLLVALGTRLVLVLGLVFEKEYLEISGSAILVGVLEDEGRD